MERLSVTQTFSLGDMICFAFGIENFRIGKEYITLLLDTHMHPSSHYIIIVSSLASLDPLQLITTLFFHTKLKYSIHLQGRDRNLISKLSGDILDRETKMHIAHKDRQEFVMETK